MYIHDNIPVIQAGNGRFSYAAVYSNEGVIHGVDATLEKLIEDEATVTDMGEAQEGWWRRRS